MKIHDSRGSHSTGLMLLLCCVACVALVISFAMPLESRGAGGLAVKESDEGLSMKDLKTFREMVPIHISAEIVSLEVTVMDDAYVGEALIQPFNHEELGANAINAIIPSNRVQRMFELAMSMGERIDCYGYKMEAPAGHAATSLPFYKIVIAKVQDYDVGLIMATQEAP
jgi:hypothetical protein